MPRKTVISLLSIALLTAMTVTPIVEAQRDRDEDRRGGDRDGRRGRSGRGFRGFGGGRGGGFGGGTSILGLLRIDKVREEIKLEEGEQELVELLNDQIQEGRPDFPENYRDLPEAEQEAAREEFGEKMRKWSEEQTATAKDTLRVILKPAQYTRLTQILIQNQGINALQDPDVVANLKLSDEQQKKIAETMQANEESRREEVMEMVRGGEGRGGFDRGAISEKIESLRKQGDEKIMALLTADQKAAFEALKGAHFEMPEPRGFRGGRGFGGRRSGGDGGRPGRPGGDGEDRPQRPE